MEKRQRISDSSSEDSMPSLVSNSDRDSGMDEQDDAPMQWTGEVNADSKVNCNFCLVP